MNTEIFNSLVEEHKDKFTKTTMFGVPISELNDDHLRACICVCGELLEDQRKSSQQERDMHKLFRQGGH